MKKKSNHGILTRFILIIAVLLIVVSCGFLIYQEIKRSVDSSKKDDIVSELINVIGNTSPGLVDESLDKNIPYYSLDGVNYAGILEYSSGESKYPIISAYSKDTLDATAFVYSGSVYNGSLVIFGYSSDRGFDFTKSCGIDDMFTFTDMLGNKFSYVVSSVSHIESPDDFLDGTSSDLTLIVDSFTDNYVLIQMKSPT